MKIEIIKAQKGNLLEVLYIIRECSRQLIEKGVKYWNNSIADYKEIAADIAAENIFMVKVNYVPVGTVTLRPNLEENTLEIDRLAIYPAFQRQGLAQRLIDFAKEVAREKNIHRITGLPLPDDIGLKQLLEHNNFVPKEKIINAKSQPLQITYEFDF